MLTLRCEYLFPKFFKEDILAGEGQIHLGLINEEGIKPDDFIHGDLLTATLFTSASLTCVGRQFPKDRCITIHTYCDVNKDH